MKILVLKYKAVNKGFFEATVDVSVPEWGLEIREIKVFAKDGKQWLGLPSREYEVDGKKAYFPYLRFTSTEATEAFKAAVLKELKPSLQQEPQRESQYSQSRFTPSHEKVYIPDEEIPF